MKRMFFLTVMCFAMLSIANSQSIPLEIQQRLQDIQDEARTRLDEFRISNRGALPRNGLRWSFSSTERILSDSLGLELNMGMVFDDPMRDRMVQLMRGEFREDELDTLLERDMKRSIRHFERRALREPQIDTLSIFVKARNNLYDSLEAQNSLDIVKRWNRVYDLEVFRSLQLDTLSIFKQTFNEIVERERERERERLLTNARRRINTTLVGLAGRIDDERFTQPLIELLDIPNPGAFPAESEALRRHVIVALVRMRVEPFYSDFVRERTLTTEQIMSDERLNFDLFDFVNVLGTQQAFLELSRFLLSSKPYAVEIDERGSHFFPVSLDALHLIHDNIRNEDLHEIIRDHTPPYRERLVYEWMQANYGNYEIRRIW